MKHFLLPNCGRPTGPTQARALAAEMHAGFAPLHGECPMNMSRPAKPIR
jgi:hypothetical protein